MKFIFYGKFINSCYKDIYIDHSFYKKNPSEPSISSDLSGLFFGCKSTSLASNNASSVSYGRVMYLWGGVEDFGMEDNVLNGSTTTSTSINLSLVYAYQMLGGKWQFRNNTFTKGSIGIYMYGISQTILIDGAEITGNTFSNVRRGLDLTYFNDLLVTDNTIQSDGDMGIYVLYGDGAMVIRGNRITVGSGYGIYLYLCDGGVAPVGTAGLVANNTISHYANSSRGIYLNASTRQNIYYNSVNSLTGTNSRSFEMTGGNNLNIVNNIFANPAGGYAYVVSTPSAITSSDYNDYYSTGVNLAYWGTSNIVDLSALQAANSKDVNSLSINPQFASQTNLHVKSAILDSAATPLAGVIDDMDKELRDASFPDIGADEYVYGFNYAPVITSLPDTVLYLIPFINTR